MSEQRIGSDVFDSYDVDKRIEELEFESVPSKGTDWRKFPNSEMAEEFANLIKFRNEVMGYNSEWRYGVTFIALSYFEEYAQEFAADVGYLSRDVMDWPYNHIDWEGAAEELRQDFTEIELDGKSYLYLTS